MGPTREVQEEVMAQIINTATALANFAALPEETRQAKVRQRMRDCLPRGECRVRVNRQKTVCLVAGGVRGVPSEGAFVIAGMTGKIVAGRQVRCKLGTPRCTVFEHLVVEDMPESGAADRWNEASHEEQEEFVSRILAACEEVEPPSNVDGFCLVPKGFERSHNGYVRASFKSFMTRTHRYIFAFEKLDGMAVADGVDCDHVCKNRACQNSDHIELEGHGAHPTKEAAHRKGEA